MCFWLKKFSKTVVSLATYVYLQLTSLVNIKSLTIQDSPQEISDSYTIKTSVLALKTQRLGV